jgi:alpha-D-xyloside xylohydrolase
MTSGMHSWERTEHGVTWVSEEGRVSLTWYGPDILRLQAGGRAHRPSLSVVAAPSAPLGWTVNADAAGWSMQGPGLTARVDGTGRITLGRAGRKLLQICERTYPTNAYPDTADQRGAGQRFVLDPSDALYGLGQHQDGVMDRRGSRVELIHGNVTIALPVIVSTGGWGILWDNPSHTVFSDDADGMQWWSEVADGVDYYLIAGDTMAAVVAGLHRLTGAPPPLPRAFSGVVMSKERYRTADELSGVVAEHRRRGLPLDVVVQDWQYWGKGMANWNSMRHDPATFGDLPAAVRAIHADHAQVLISIWPRIGLGTAFGQAMQAAGHLFVGLPEHQDKVYDAFDPAARKLYWQFAREGLFAHDVDGWWMDGTEPEFVDCHEPQRHKASQIAQRDTAAGSWARVLNAYALATTQGMYEGQLATAPERRVAILTRSAFTGQQRYATALWSGDISARWEVFAKQIVAGQHVGLCGFPVWTTDTGGFFVRGRGGMFPGGVADPAFRELFLRWTQFACFCPMMRAHGTQTPREPWHMGAPGEPMYEGVVAALRLRERLVPYSYSLQLAAYVEGGAAMLPLAARFPDDAQARRVGDQFYYGPALMVCPVVQPLVHAPTEDIDALSSLHVRHQGERGWWRCIMAADGSQVSAQRVGHDLDLSWDGNPPEGISGQEYAISYEGLVQPEGRTRLRLRVAGQARIWIDGELVLDAWQDGPLRSLDLPPLADGQRPVAMRIHYAHTSGESLLKLGWHLPPPVITRRADAPMTRAVYLPPGRWIDIWTGETHDGGVTRDLPAPWQHCPVLAPAGAILPLGADRCWHDQVDDAELELRIHPGADGAFTLREDAGNGQGFARGEHSAIPMRWDDTTRTLHLGARVGSFPGMIVVRRFRIVVVRPGHALDLDESTPEGVITYNGQAFSFQATV